MISVHTPPGTMVVALSDGGEMAKRAGRALVVGRVYTVARIAPAVHVFSGVSDFGVELAEFDHSRRFFILRRWSFRRFKVLFDRSSFRRLDLPEVLASCLVSQPLVVDEPQPVSHLSHARAWQLLPCRLVIFSSSQTVRLLSRASEHREFRKCPTSLRSVASCR